MGPRFEEYKNGQVKIDVSVVSGFDTLFSEIENDARLGLGLFDVCKYIHYCGAVITCMHFLPGQNHAQHKHKYMSSTFQLSRLQRLWVR